MELKAQIHNIAPLDDEKSRELILGSFPSVKSRKAAFFYAHPQNRFWSTLAAVLGEEMPKTVEEKKAMVLRRGVARPSNCRPPRRLTPDGRRKSSSKSGARH